MGTLFTPLDNLPNPSVLDLNTSIPKNTPKLGAGYCPDIQRFGNAYKGIHGYTSLTVCTFGTIANILNVIVLTRKEMITPTNYILTALAIADLLNMVEYVPFAVYMNFLPDDEDGGKLRRTYPWAVFVLFHSNFSQICHTTAIWLTLTLAIWRYIMVTRPIQCKALCSMYRAKLAIALAYIISPILCFPIFYSFSISKIYPKGYEKNILEASNMDGYNHSMAADDLRTGSMPRNASLKFVNLSGLAKSFSVLKQFNFWCFSIIIKLITCTIMTIVSVRLINYLLDAKKRREQLFGKSLPLVVINQPPPQPDIAKNRDESSSRNTSFTLPTGDVCATTRTTRMLLAVLFLFLITEVPQGILALLSDLMGEEFFTFCYMSLSDLMDFVALLNSAINFILYCGMSSRFRVTFKKMFRLEFVFNSKRFSA